jgi:peptide-methionine (S)-S-oxide reductase
MRKVAGLVILVLAALTVALPAATRFPDPARDLPAGTGERTAVFAGGCFWGIEGVFERLKGVSSAVSGFAGGSSATAHYDMVSTGTTGHAESVQVTYDSRTITYGQLLKVFFAIAHDPTELNRQGPDEGPQYRSAIFYGTSDEKDVAEAYIQQLSEAKIFRRRIVTKVVPLEGFYAAEPYHQHFLDRNPTHPYIVYNDLPKIDALKRTFPELVNDRYSAAGRR